MGCYDTFKFKCKNCGKIIYLQTKLGINCLREIKIGGKFVFEDSIILLKNKCDFCKKFNAVEIRDNVFVKVCDIKDATIQEFYFGEFQHIKKGD